MLKRVLIANRGEIAIRLARAARELDIIPCGIASLTDRHALHRRSMDVSLVIDRPTGPQAYLDIEAILGAARELHVDAIHPGYGFLSERADFASTVEAAGFIFIGPSPKALAIAGDKRVARGLAKSAGIAILEGYDGAEQDPEYLFTTACALGFPLLIKATNGGGGRGQRRVTEASDFLQALTEAKREALAAFGDNSVLLERYLESPRHIELQIVGDAYGSILTLGERDCSLQRRRQKVIEEAPAFGLLPEIREALQKAALTIAQAASYSNVGTVEFLLDAENRFTFLEVNARLQVEHPVTEAVMSIDLAVLQYRIAAGEALPAILGSGNPHGWAIEARICAEDPAHDLLPSTGIITQWHMPQGPGIRIDQGVDVGSMIPLDYDSLMAKLIVWGHNRSEAQQRLRDALSTMQIEGLPTNLSFLRALASDEAFVRGAVPTTHIDTNYQRFMPIISSSPLHLDHLILGLSALLVDSANWRCNSVGRVLLFTLAGQKIAYRASRSGRLWLLWRQDALLKAWNNPGDENAQNDSLPEMLHIESDSLPAPGGGWHFNLRYHRPDAGLEYHEVSGLCEPITSGWSIRRDRDPLPLTLLQRSVDDLLTLSTPSARKLAGKPSQTTILTPMPGRLLRLLVAVGSVVEDRQVLAILEAMKMEHRIEATGAGLVTCIYGSEGDIFGVGSPILELEPLGGQSPDA